MRLRNNFLLPALLLAAIVPLTSRHGRAQDGAAGPAARALAAGTWRSLGPANFGGRIVDFAVDPTDRFTWYAATATGGVWKTTNNGQTFEPLFDREAVYSIGDIAIAPSDPQVLYIGTGEANNQRSSYWGNGVHRSADAGKTWNHVGLDGTDHIGRVVVHPTDPQVAYVAAVGALYRPNPERGIYRTRDGGQSWTCVKHIDEDVGFVDIAIDPKTPDNLLAASYDRRRRAWDFRDEGPGSALWRSGDGGDSWTKVRGIPDGAIGRIGVEFHPADPQIAYAIVENNNPAPAARAEERADRGAGRRREVPPDVDPELYPLGLGNPDAAPAAGAAAAPARPIGGEVYKSTDGGQTWKKVSERAVAGSPHYYYGQLRLDPNDTETLYALGVRVAVCRDGGRTWNSDEFDSRLHVDHHALWIDPADSRRALLGNDGGIGQTWDGGRTWIFHDDLPIGQFYAVTVDLREPYNVYGGTQDNGTWGMPSRSVTNRPLGHADAYKIGGGDGFHVQVDPTDPDVVYSESQFGGLSRLHLATDQRRSIKPRSARGQPPLRFNWMAPLLISPHDPRTVYFGSQYLHRSENRGDDWDTISGDLSSNDGDRLRGDVPHCTITTIDESPRQKGQLWVGTDDGRVWTSPDGGRTWVELSDRFPGLPPRLWVSRVACSPHDAARAYVAFTGYREDDRTPYLFLTTDGGTSFRSIVNDLPPGGSVNVVREHPRNADCVLVGTEFGVFASVDAGASWHPLGSGLPTQPVHDLVVHPREEDVVIGTHGRGIYILDATALAEFGAETLARPQHVFAARDGRLVRNTFPTVRYPGTPAWTADRQENRAVFRYHLREDLDGRVQISVLDIAGKVVFERRGETTAGLHEVVWAPTGGRGGRGGGGAAATGGPGDYLLRIAFGETVVERPFRVHPAPGTDADAAAEDGEEFDSFAPREEPDRDRDAD
jgi:photosystem II stability/assembly factor-like uncharacterized protein